MVGRLRCLSVFTLSSLLLLGGCLHDVGASNCDQVIHKQVGDTVELLTCLTTEVVTRATWKKGTTIVADKSLGVSPQFGGKLKLNPTSWSLTVENLTLQDSDVFSFVSGTNDKQIPTVTITLHVHEPITSQPNLTYISNWNNQNNSCTVLLECRSASNNSVTYIWSVRNQTQNGSRLQYNMRPEDGETKFTCTTSNPVSNKSASQTVTCSNLTTTTTELVILLSAVGGCLMVVIIVGIIVAVCYCKQERAGSDSNDLTVYADVTDFANQSGTSTSKPCSLYETIDNRVTPAPVPQTVYDKIHFDRAKKVLPYQDVS